MGSQERPPPDQELLSAQYPSLLAQILLTPFPLNSGETLRTAAPRPQPRDPHLVKAQGCLTSWPCLSRRDIDGDLRGRATGCEGLAGAEGQAASPARHSFSTENSSGSGL